MISIIIPTYNEEKIIEKNLQNLLSLKGNFEIIISDSSNDNTAKIAERYAKVVPSKKGRGVQMNTGTKHANGDILLFLHADSTLNKNSLSHIENAISQGHIGGRFTLCANSTHPLIKLMIRLNQTDLSRLHYGDQAFFCTKETFAKLKGYREIEIMEDIDFYLRMKNLGSIKLIKEPLQLNLRRFHNKNITKILFLMAFLKLSYSFGADHKKLARFYSYSNKTK